MSAAERMREAAAFACTDLIGGERTQYARNALKDAAAKIRSLPLPAPTPVEEAERAFMEAAEAWIFAPRDSGAEYLAERAMDVAHDALLAARQQEKEARDAP